MSDSEESDLVDTKVEYFYNCSCGITSMGSFPTLYALISYIEEQAKKLSHDHKPIPMKRTIVTTVTEEVID